MTRTLDNLQELGWKADNGQYIRTEAILVAFVSVIRRYEKDASGEETGQGMYKANFIIRSAVTGETVAIYEREFPTLEALTELLGIDDLDEVWEVLE